MEKKKKKPKCEEFHSKILKKGKNFKEKGKPFLSNDRNRTLVVGDSDSEHKP